MWGWSGGRGKSLRLEKGGKGERKKIRGGGGKGRENTRCRLAEKGGSGEKPDYCRRGEKAAGIDERGGGIGEGAGPITRDSFGGGEMGGDPGGPPSGERRSVSKG